MTPYCAASERFPIAPRRALSRYLPRAAAFWVALHSMAYAQENSRPVADPSKPTSINTKLEIGLGYSDYQDGYTLGPRLTAQFGLGPTFGMEVGTGLLYPSFDFAVGQDKARALQLSDTRVRALWTPTKLQRTPGRGYFSSGIYLDSSLPTGNENNRVGTGSLLLAPGFISGFGLNSRGTASVWPILSYVGSVKKIICDELPEGGLPPCEEGASNFIDAVQAWRVDLPLIFNFPRGRPDLTGNSSLTIWPSYTKLFSHNKSSSTSLEMNYMYMLGPTRNLTFKFTHDFVKRDSPGARRDSFQMSYGMFF